MNTKQAKQLITEGARELFPRILPSRLQEARKALLAHLGLTLDDFGYYPSGQPKFENLCSQVVKTLKATGEMTTQGWEWSWVEGGTVVPSPVIKEATLEMFFEDYEGFEEAPSLYDLSCEETVIRLVAITPCFGKVVQTDSECQGCPLLDLCLEKKGEVRVARNKTRQAKKEALEKASEMGYDLKGVKIPKSARIHELTHHECKSETTCIVSGETISTGEVAVHIPSWGMVKPVIATALVALKNI